MTSFAIFDEHGGCASMRNNTICFAASLNVGWRPGMTFCYMEDTPDWINTDYRDIYREEILSTPWIKSLRLTDPASTKDIHGWMDEQRMYGRYYPFDLDKQVRHVYAASALLRAPEKCHGIETNFVKLLDAGLGVHEALALCFLVQPIGSEWVPVYIHDRDHQPVCHKRFKKADVQNIASVLMSPAPDEQEDAVYSSLGTLARRLHGPWQHLFKKKHARGPLIWNQLRGSHRAEEYPGRIPELIGRSWDDGATEHTTDEILEMVR